MSTLSHAPLAEFERSLKADLSPTLRTSIFSTFCRINTLYMGGGGDSDFMRDLATQNGGRYVRL